MSTWPAQCRKCVFVPRTSFTSALFKVLITLKLLHGSRVGARGSTLEDIALHMIKHFCIDGDVRSQILASLKYGVKMSYIQRKGDKFSLISPGAAIQLAPGCSQKQCEIERIISLFPVWYEANNCQHNFCGGISAKSCCGKDKNRPVVPPCCLGRQSGGDPCCKRQQQNVCCNKRKKVPRVYKPICHRNGTCRKPALCRHCPPPYPDLGIKFKGDAHTNCTCCQK